MSDGLSFALDVFGAVAAAFMLFAVWYVTAHYQARIRRLEDKVEWIEREMELR